MKLSVTRAPARRSLLDRPQKFGILPTLWFWNDWEAQRLILPFVFIITPALVLLNILQLWLRFSALVPIVANVVIPFLTMGLVERHVRARLLAEKNTDLPCPAMPDATRGRLLMLSMALLSGVITVLVLLQVSMALLGAAVFTGGVLIAIALRRDSPRSRRLAPGENSNVPGLPANLTLRQPSGSVVSSVADPRAEP